MSDMNTTPVLPDWTRWSWASLDEREWWQPLFTRASSAFGMLERLSVVEGIRPAAFVNIPATELISATTWARDHGILCVPYTITGVSQNYSATSIPIRPGDPFDYRVLFVRPELYAQTAAASDNELGKLLGYPECCRSAFDATWGRGQVDSTWEQTIGGQFPQGPVEANTMLRWMGIRFVSHMPCHYNCQHSVRIGQQMFELGLTYGYREEMYTIREVLQWPVEWSRLFGIAEIVTPALKISTRTDWTPTKDTFRKDGVYQKPSKKWWTQNGFGTADAMRSAHDVVSASVSPLLPKKSRVLDLGCGNGRLLRQLKSDRPDIRIGGVDINHDAIIDASGSVMDLTSKFWHEHIEVGSWRQWLPTVVLYTPGRLLEMDSTVAAKVRSWLSEIPIQIVYSYEDWLSGTTLSELCGRAQLPVLSESLVKMPGIEVGVIYGANYEH